jgi:GNAT superfamily N-acetyltransferase
VSDHQAAFPFSDIELARRLERAEGRANVEFVEARAKVFPASGAEWIEVAGAYAMFDGVASPLTQTFGLGVFEPATAATLEEIEAFFKRHGASVFHEISPLAEPSLLPLLHERGYHPVELTSMMYRPIARGFQFAAPFNERLQVRLIRPDEHELWAQTSVKGWSELTDLLGFMLEISQVSAARANALSFLAELDGRAIGTASLIINDGVALLAGASTIPEGRKQGAQLALLESRLRYAVEQGCDLAVMGAQPGSASQRNAERQGFRIAYTRIKWGLAQERCN